VLPLQMIGNIIVRLVTHEDKRGHPAEHAQGPYPLDTSTVGALGFSSPVSRSVDTAVVSCRDCQPNRSGAVR
jgi:hypothetical protein